MRVLFLDTEFINKNSVDLISIGVVDLAGREYYAINENCKLEKASPWVKENVISQLPPKDYNPLAFSPNTREQCKAWKPYLQIKYELLDFIGKDEVEIWGNCCGFDFFLFSKLMSAEKTENWFIKIFQPIDFNKGFDNYPENLPYYFNDIQQLRKFKNIKTLPKQESGNHNALEDAKHIKKCYQYLMSLGNTYQGVGRSFLG